jgi:hypothetical protein
MASWAETKARELAQCCRTEEGCIYEQSLRPMVRQAIEDAIGEVVDRLRRAGFADAPGSAMGIAEGLLIEADGPVMEPGPAAPTSGKEE